MKIWIRTQDKEMLTKIEDVSFIKDSQTNAYVILTTKTSIPTWHHLHYGGAIILGAYKTKERALQVLDEIQNLLIKSNRIFVNKKINDFDLEKLKPILNGIDVVVADKDTKIASINTNTIVYQMPEK